MIEIEKKFPVGDAKALRQQLSQFATQEASWVTKSQSDEYFNHHQLKFDQLDIALRIRSTGEKHILTYKGPNQAENTKIREEFEVELSQQQAEGVTQVLLGIGMHSVARVQKRREKITVEWEGTNITACLDTVEEVGSFVELELVVAGEDQVQDATATIESLSQALSLEGSTTTSYLEMLLKNHGDI